MQGLFEEMTFKHRVKHSEPFTYVGEEHSRQRTLCKGPEEE